LDTDVCSAYLKGNNAVANRFIQYGGQLHLSVVSLGELYTWALRASAPASRLQNLLSMLSLLQMRDVDQDVARKFGEVDAFLLDHGVVVPDVDLLNAAIALFHNLTMVTHNVPDYARIPGLRVDDWLAP
jgi:tRNA(fMet)-specific endonuclease VapC